MTLETGDILTIDATVITGILILLTVSSFAQGQEDDTFIDDFRKISTIVIILPFGASAFFTLGGKLFQIKSWNYHRISIYGKYDEARYRLMRKYELSDMDHYDILKDRSHNIPFDVVENYKKELDELEKNEDHDFSKLTNDYQIEVPSTLSIILMLAGFILITILMSVTVILEVFFRK